MFENAYSGATELVTARRNAGGRSSTLGFFAEDDWTLGNLVLTGGARVDRWTITGGFFTARDPPAALPTTHALAAPDGRRPTGPARAPLHTRHPLSPRAPPSPPPPPPTPPPPPPPLP